MAVNSVLTQTFKDFELIIVDDGCDPAVEEVIKKDERIKIVRQVNSGRMKARNTGMEAAIGEWICWLDSDDEYSSVYLECVNEAINKYDDYKIFNFGAIIIHKDYGTSIRPTFKPKELEKGHEVFRGGSIGTGSFVFHRSVYEDLGGLIVAGLWDFAEQAKKEFPELREFYPKGRELGNPWGDDYYYFYKITRKYHSKPLDTALYIQHHKNGHELKII